MYVITQNDGYLKSLNKVMIQMCKSPDEAMTFLSKEDALEFISKSNKQGKINNGKQFEVKKID
jgi:hypothetical protein